MAAMIEFRPCPVDEEPAAALAQGMRDEIAALYDGLNLDGPEMPKAGPNELAPPGGTFIVGFDDAIPVCCGGLKALPDGACEIKKMFVAGEARGRGVARALLVELERLARELGYTIARLDTGPKQTRAQRMYERAGYAPIENFNANPVATFFGEKALAPPARRGPAQGATSRRGGPAPGATSGRGGPAPAATRGRDPADRGA
jgi:GNAT superfamily N-acetyltransferase